MSFRSIVNAAKILWQESDWPFYWPIIRKFGFAVRVKGSPRSDVATCTLEVPHFPGLYLASLLLSQENYSQLAAGALFDCPAICCECGQPAQRRIEVRTKPERGSRIRLKLSEVPVCERCRIKQTDRSAPLLVKTKFEEGKLHTLLLVAQSQEFLNETSRRGKSISAERYNAEVRLPDSRSSSPGTSNVIPLDHFLFAGQLGNRRGCRAKEVAVTLACTRWASGFDT